MMLEPIHDGNVGGALAILSRGFPSRSPLFWQSGLERQAKYQNAVGGPLGYVMRAGGRDAGIILTMRSLRTAPDGACRTVLNLSSWYVDEEHRWLAPRMLQKVLAERADLFTDLTPSPPVRQMVRRLGFTPWNEGALLSVLAVSALQRGAQAAVATPDEERFAALDPATRAMLDDHAALGCIVAVMEEGGVLHPLIFSRTWRKHMPSARLVYARSVAAVRRNIGAVARFLMVRGVLLLEFPANRGEEAFGAWFTTRPPPTFARGPVEPDVLDHAYSEFVFLQI